MKRNISLIASFLLLFLFNSGNQIQAEESEFYLKYLKGGIGGGGVEDIPLKMWTETGQEVKVERWGGTSS